MKQLWNRIGQVAFWLAWPGFWLILNNTERSRLLLFHEGELLVMKDWFAGKWALPGGGKHRAESPLEALIREVDEELGIKLVPDEVKSLFTETVRDKGISVNLDYFVAKITTKPEIKPSRLEVSEFAWLPPAELNSKNAGLDVLHGLTKYHQK